MLVSGRVSVCWGFCYISDTKTLLSLVASDNHLSAKVFLFLLEGDEAEEWTLQLWLNMICQGLTQYFTNCVCVFSYSNFEPWPTLPYQVIIIFYPSLYPLPILVFGVKTMGKVDGKTIESRWHNCHALVYLRLGLSQCILNRFRLMRLFNHFFRCSPFFMENFPKLTEIFTPRLPPLSEL